MSNWTRYDDNFYVCDRVLGLQNSDMLFQFFREQRTLPWKPNLGENEPKLHKFQFCIKYWEILAWIVGCHAGVGEFKHAIGISQRSKKVAKATKKISKNQPKLHWFHFRARNREIFPVNSRVFGVRELKYAIRIFKGAKKVVMTAKFRQKYAKTAHILVLYKVWKRFCMYDRVFGIAIRISQGA